MKGNIVQINKLFQSYIGTQKVTRLDTKLICAWRKKAHKYTCISVTLKKWYKKKSI